MKLEKLEIYNFRQFYGEQSVEFAGDSGMNVTVIHGANGSGKTTILNALLWLFYGDLNLPKPDQIASERAMAEAGPSGTVKIRVQLLFMHEGSEYTAVRSKTVRRTNSSDFSGTEVSSDIHLEYVDEVGNRKVRGNASESLQQILPERLREIFFFDGETIDELSAIGGQEKIQTAIQNIMGLTILERARRHLDAVRKRFEKEASRHGSNELSDLYSEREEIEEHKQSLSEELEAIRDSKRKSEEELDDIEQRLNELEDSRDLQQEREQLESEIEELNQERTKINDEISDRISSAGHVPFAAPALEETAKMLKEKRDQGEIPSEIKTQFVNDLLEMRECICGRELVPGTEPHQNVKHWRETAGSSEIEEAAMSIASRLTEIGNEEEQVYTDIEKLLSRRSSVTDEVQRKTERISEISSQLEEVDTENISSLETRRGKLDNQISEYNQQIGTISERIDQTESDIEDITIRIKEVEQQNKKAELAQRRAQMAKYLRGRVEELFNNYQDEVRKRINDRVNKTFRKIIVKDYYADINEDYSLRILKDVGSDETISVAKSTGERQVASLSFISALVSIARDRYKSEEESIHFTGGIYPMIMDSPFGALDPEYQKRVSSVLPNMAEQVVVMVTQSQWSEEVAGEMDKVAGDRYYLRYHDPSDEESAEYEYTEIVHQNGGDD
jgi:DNA sulfur modification protein DndD